MNALVILIPAALLLAGLALAAFLWSLKTNQYEDLDGAAWRILSDDDADAPPTVTPSAQPAHAPRS